MAGRPSTARRSATAARTPRMASKRVRLERDKLTRLGLAIADGLLEVGKTVIETATPPDSPFDPYPTGQGLVKQGGVIVMVHGKKVAGWSQRGLQPQKPRPKTGDAASRVADEQKGIVALVGWGFPARLVNNGTLTSRAQPFATSAVDQVAPHSTEIIRDIVAPALAID